MPGPTRKTQRQRITAADVATYEEALADELPRFRVIYKDESPLQRLIAKLVWPFNRHYLTRYTTVMFGRVYFPSRAWRHGVAPEIVYKTLRHEAVHLRDARRFPLVFHLSYLFVLPAVFTMRAVWEWRAYAETMRVEHELWGRVPDHVINHIKRCFTGPDYLYMCPFPSFIERRLEALRSRIESGADRAE